jgi:CheY-like chemotaxis protein
MKTILAIEDEPSILENILETLAFGGFSAVGAANGLIGVHLARQHLPNLILCDALMPELDGYHVLLDLRSDPATASIPFIFLTARVEREAVQQALASGADGYLTKPFTVSELLVAVTAGLERHAAIVPEHEKKVED